MTTYLIPHLLLAAETGTAGGLISLLIWLLVLAAVIYVIVLILRMLPIPEPFRTIIMVVIGLILLVFLVQHLGLL